MKRIRLTAVTMTMLFCAYQLYAQWFASVTAIEGPLPRPPEPGAAPVQSATIRETAERFLRDAAWTQRAEYTFERADHVFIYTDAVELLDAPEEETNRRVRFAPFAMVVIDPEQPAAEPYVIQCESAVVEFENPFRLEFGAPNPGRLQNALLDGRVSITGPDGLALAGSNFRFYEESALLYSDSMIEFAWGPQPGQSNRISGTADGVQMDLLPSSEGALGRDGPRIGGVRRIRLLRDVDLLLEYEEKGQARHATVSSRGSFEYTVETRIATFEDDVLIERPTNKPGAPAETDLLRCDWLALQFEEGPAEMPVAARTPAETGDGESPDALAEESPAAEARHPFGNLRFRQLRAVGDQAELRSDENRLTAQMQELRYDAATRTVLLIDSQAVRVQYNASNLVCPRVELVHAEEGDVQTLTCRGAGRLDQIASNEGPAQFRAAWQERLHLAPDPRRGLTLIRLDGTAQVVRPGRNGMQAERLSLWIDPEAARSFDNSVSAVRPGEPLPIKYAEAQGDVVLASPEFRIETERLRAEFQSAELAPRESGNGLRPAGLAPSAADPETRWRLRADDVHVRVLHDPASETTDIADATASGAVTIRRETVADAGESAAASVEISGDDLHLENAGGTGHVVTLSGAPAWLRQEDFYLEGGEGSEIVFQREANTARVNGRGMLKFPVSVDLSGEPLEEPAPLDVHWREQMSFDGRTAQFFGNVVLKLNDGHVNESRLYCEDMNVVLNRDVSFTDEPSGSPEMQLQQVTCREGVRTELYKWEGTRLSGVRISELAEFTLDHETGTLQGVGPGVISSWSRGADRRISIAPDAVAEANQPADSDSFEWEYTRVRFSRSMTGNAKQRTVVLHGRVRAIYAPVERAREEFQRSEFSGDSPSAAHAVWLGCDDLAVTLHPWGDDRDYATFGASGHCELEGRSFRAVADLISFDQSKELFTLKGLGDRKASIYYQRHPGADAVRFAGQLIEFIPSRQHVSVQGASGFQATP